LDGLKQPETITITFTIGSNRNEKEHKVFVVPDQGKFGVEWTLTHTYPDFIKKVLPRFTTAEHEEPGFQAMCFELWGMLVQGNALTAWSMVVAKHFNTDEKKSAENAFEQAIALYLKSLVGLKYISDQVICHLRKQKKPAMMPYRSFERRHHQLLLYVMQNTLLCRTVNILTPQELVEQLFLAQPKAHQAKYAKISEDVEQDTMTSFAPSLRAATLKTLPMAHFKS
jgi:hypothetical protein